MTKSARNRLKCPSAEPKFGAELLGVVTGKGAAAILPKTISLDARFFFEGSSINELDSRFRFTNFCVEKSCAKWANGQCGLVDRLKEINSMAVEAVAECSIRSNCRWFNQAGDVACKICPTVVRQQRLEL